MADPTPRTAATAREWCPDCDHGMDVHGKTAPGFCDGITDDVATRYRCFCTRTTLAAAEAPGRVAGVDVETLANIIRTVDGNHDLGAGELAERILAALAAPASPAGVSGKVCWDAPIRCHLTPDHDGDHHDGEGGWTSDGTPVGQGSGVVEMQHTPVLFDPTGPVYDSLPHPKASRYELSGALYRDEKAETLDDPDAYDRRILLVTIASAAARLATPPTPALTAALDVVWLRRHTHDDRSVILTRAGNVDDCLLCRALVDAGILTLDRVTLKIAEKR